MLYLNLMYAVKVRGIPNYRAAAAVGMTESRFSRASRGLAEFSDEERRRLAEFLGFPEVWLFAGVSLPVESVSTPERMVHA